MRHGGVALSASRLSRELRRPDSLSFLAIESLALSALPGTVSALDALLDEVPPVEAANVARTLAQQSGAERRLVARVKESFRLETGPDSEVIAALLSGKRITFDNTKMDVVAS